MFVTYQLLIVGQKQCNMITKEEILKQKIGDILVWRPYMTRYIVMISEIYNKEYSSCFEFQGFILNNLTFENNFFINDDVRDVWTKIA